MKLCIVLLVCAVAAFTSAQSPTPSNCERYCRRWETYCCGVSQPIHLGRCPRVVPGCSEDVQKSNPQRCESDGDCASVDKCCYDGCLQYKTCKTALHGLPDPVINPGLCPRPRGDCLPWLGPGGVESRHCESDSDCGRRLKCCTDPCSGVTVCMSPFRLGGPQVHVP